MMKPPGHCSQRSEPEEDKDMLRTSSLLACQATEDWSSVFPSGDRVSSCLLLFKRPFIHLNVHLSSEAVDA